LWLHAHNAHPHAAKVSTDYITRHEMKRPGHPPDSPDMAPSDFFLFGSAKRKLTGYRAESESELLVRIGVISAEMPWDVLNAVFSSGWTDCTKVCGPMEITLGELKNIKAENRFYWGHSSLLHLVWELGCSNSGLSFPFSAVKNNREGVRCRDIIGRWLELGAEVDTFLHARVIPLDQV
jgi:hypothetical protein